MGPRCASRRVTRSAALVVVLAITCVGAPAAGSPRRPGSRLLVGVPADEQTVPGHRISVPVVAAGDARFVDALYKDLLGRFSEPDGRAYWLSQLAAGDSRSRITVRM